MSLLNDMLISYDSFCLRPSTNIVYKALCLKSSFVEIVSQNLIVGYSRRQSMLIEVVACLRKCSSRDLE